MMRGLYRGLTIVVGPLIDLYLLRRRAAGKEDVQRFPERQGRPGMARPQGPLVWFHAASVGEALSALPLIELLIERRPDLTVLTTTGTVTSARLLAQRLPEGVIHQYVPVDRPGGVRRFLDHWRPDLALWLESELWPNLVGDAQRRGVPMVLINGRMSPRSFARWKRLPWLIRPLLKGFTLCLGQTESDAERFRILGAAKARCAGNIKFAAPPLPADPEELDVLDRAFGRRPTWLAVSTHAGEERIAATIHKALAPDFPGLLTVIAPRHPARGTDIANELRHGGMIVAQRSRQEMLTDAHQIYLADTMGELGLFYRLAQVVFVGGTLVPHGGQNPLEPARLGCALVHGPSMTNFREMAGQFHAAGAALEVPDEAALSAAVRRLLADPGERARLADSAARLAASRAGVLDDVMAEIAPLLPALPRESGAKEPGASA